MGEFTRHFLPCYQFDVQSHTQVSWHSVFVFTDALGAQQTLSVPVCEYAMFSSLSLSLFLCLTRSSLQHKFSVFALAIADNLHSPHVESLIKWTDKQRHLVLTKIPYEIPLAADLVWTNKALKQAKKIAQVNAEAKIPVPMPLCRNVDETSDVTIDGYEPRVLVYPFYYGSYSYQQKTYRVVVDGFTKEVAGEKPFGLKNRKWAGLMPSFK